MTRVKCVLIATGSLESARRDAISAGLDPVLTLTKAQCAGSVGDVRRRARELGIRTVAIHSADWPRQPLAQFFELAAARLSLPECLILRSGGAPEHRTSRPALAARVAALPLEVARGLSLSSAEVARLVRIRRRTPARRHPAPIRDGDTVLAIWLGSTPGVSVGGAVTHVSGVLGGFRDAGLRVALVALYEPPPQMLGAVDEVISVPPMGRHARVTGEITAVAANRFARQAAAHALDRLRPAFIYQRYDGFVTCGVDLGQQLGVPVVVEWNNSAVWTRNYWHATHRFKRLFTPLLMADERYVATRADLLAAVSEHAAAMAVDAGAPPARVVTVPNAVDLDEIDAGRAMAHAGRNGASPQPDGALIGWVGSFGVWHGAEVLVEAMSRLPERVRAVMIGDGSERDACEELARRLGVWERIEWTGSLPHLEAVRRLAECDVLASPHVQLDGGQAFFGSPTKIFEYMAIGRPIVASELEQLGEVLEDGKTARLVPPGDVAALAAAIEQTLSSPDRGRALGEAARTVAQREHTWDRRARAILERLSGVAGHPLQEPEPEARRAAA